MTVAEKWLTMMLLCLSGSTIYWMPLFQSFIMYPCRTPLVFPIRKLGVLSSTFGFTSLIGYFPGGWLADRFSSRKLISVALVITAAGAFCILDDAVIRDMCAFVRPVGNSNRVRCFGQR